MDSDMLRSVVRQAIKEFDFSSNSEEIGIVVSVFDGIAMISGLNNGTIDEVVIFNKEIIGTNRVITGIIMAMDENYVTVLIIGDYTQVSTQDEVIRTKKTFKVNTSDAIIGRVVNGYGHPIDNLPEMKNGTDMKVDNNSPQMIERSFITKQLETGIKTIDMLIPIGLGQRQLIVGDINTGKTQVALSTMINNKDDKDFISIYVSIGQKINNAPKYLNTLKKNNVKNFILVNANSSDPVSMRYLAPMVGCSIGEYFRNKGKKVLIIYDDLNSHAVAYREISLILKRPPGREAYPGDIFYLHSKLLERSAQMNGVYKHGSLTALPIVTSFDGDISSYIITNLISITDGQIIFTQEDFAKNIYPAIKIGVSVSRVGGACQNIVLNKLISSIKIELAKYEEYKELTKMSQNITPEIKEILQHGNLIKKMLLQDLKPVSLWKQICILYGLRNKMFNEYNIENFVRFIESLQKEKQNILENYDCLSLIMKDYNPGDVYV